MNVFDYVTWRGDLTFAKDPFQEIDSLILCCLSYIRFDPLFEKKEKWTIASAAKAFFALPGTSQVARTPEDLTLLQALSQSKRYRALVISDYVSALDERKQEQFAALCVQYGKKWSICVYRGTDNTLVGWKEDFNMTYMEVIPAQAHALTYAQTIAAKTQGALMLAGHSKGGNLAVYAAAHLPLSLQKERLQAVYNHDGPGFMECEIKRAGYQAIVEKIHTYVPQSSLFGMLLEHEERYHIVHSSQVSLWQHDPYSWCVHGPRFECLPMRSANSYFMDATIRSWIAQLSNEQRAAFIDALFDLLSSTNATSIKEMNANRVRNTAIILKALGNMDEEERKLMLETILTLFSSARRSAQMLLEQAEKTYGHHSGA